MMMCSSQLIITTCSCLDITEEEENNIFSPDKQLALFFSFTCKVIEINGKKSFPYRSFFDGIVETKIKSLQVINCKYWRRK